MSSAFVFEEFDVPDPMRVELRADDMPEGFPEDAAGFEMGGELLRKRVKLPGRREPTYHVMNVDDEPLVVKGKLTDYRMGEGHARGVRNAIETMRARANLLHITWADEQWTGLLVKALFGVQGEGHITYELTFDVAVSPDADVTILEGEPLPDSDAVDRVLAQIRARPAVPPAMPPTLAQRFGAAMAAVEGGMAKLEDGMRKLEVVRDNVVGAANRVLAIGARVQQDVRAAQDIVTGTSNSLRDIAASPLGVYEWARTTPDVMTQWATIQAQHWASLQDAAGTARGCCAAAHKRKFGATQLYRVKTGDTADSIARMKLGDAGRAGELSGVRLVPGKLVRLPSAARPA